MFMMFHPFYYVLYVCKYTTFNNAIKASGEESGGVRSFHFLRRVRRTPEAYKSRRRFFQALFLADPMSNILVRDGQLYTDWKEDIGKICM